MERYYQPEIECASREQIKAWQDERLVKQVRHVWDNVPYYRKKMEEKGLTPDDIQSSDDLHKLPFITKADLREAYPYGLVVSFHWYHSSQNSSKIISVSRSCGAGKSVRPTRSCPAQRLSCSAPGTWGAPWPPETSARPRRAGRSSGTAGP